MKGRSEGLITGRKGGRSDLLLSLLEYKFKKIPTKYIHLIQNANEDKLILWAKRLINTDKIEDVFTE